MEESKKCDRCGDMITLDEVIYDDISGNGYCMDCADTLDGYYEGLYSDQDIDRHLDNMG